MIAEELRGLRVRKLPAAGVHGDAYTAQLLGITLQKKLLDRQLRLIQELGSDRFLVSFSSDRAEELDDEDLQKALKIARKIYINYFPTPPEMIGEATHLECIILGMSTNIKRIDLSRMKNLKYLQTNNKVTLLNFENRSNIEGLSLWGAIAGWSDAPNLLWLSQFPNLRYLELVRPKIESLLGVEHATKLENIKISYAQKLSDISDLSGCRHCKHVYFRNYKKVEDLSAITELSGLETLNLDNCGSVQSLAPLLGKDHLETLMMADTHVLDGRMQFIAELPELTQFFARQKPHYDVKVSDINNVVEARRAAKGR